MNGTGRLIFLMINNTKYTHTHAGNDKIFTEYFGFSYTLHWKYYIIDLMLIIYSH